MTTTQSLELALAHQRAGRLKEAEQIYRSALAEDADHPDILHLLGVVLFQSGNLTESDESLRRAIALVPDEAQFHGHLGSVLAAQGKMDEAVASFSRGMALDPLRAEIPHNLGNALQRAGRGEEAASAFLRAIFFRPGYAAARHNLVTLLRQMATPLAVQSWRSRLANRAGAKVGLAWGPIALNTFSNLAQIAGVTYFRLQKDPDKDAPFSLNLVDWTDEITQFRDLVALVAALDLVITADFPVGQIAELLGRPVFALIAASDEIHWLQNDPTSKTRFFRAQSIDGWNAPVNEVAESLAEFVSAENRQVDAHGKGSR